MYNYLVFTKIRLFKKATMFAIKADAYEFRSGWLTFFEFSSEKNKDGEKKIVTATWAVWEKDVERVEIEGK